VIANVASMSQPEPFSEQYYQENGQDSDRVALWFYERVVRRLVPAGSEALDYGCGSGYFVRRLARHFRASGFDVSPEAQRLTREHAGDVRLYGALEDVAPASFDLVTALHVLEHVPDPSIPLGAIFRWLRPGGALFVVVPNPDGWGHRLKGSDWFAYRDPTHCSLLPSGEWLHRITEAGFTLSRVGTDGLWDPPYVRRLPRPVQLPLFGAMAAGQVALGRVVLPPRWGECLVVSARRS
jgi:SAM-dependent methyltransferase